MSTWQNVEAHPLSAESLNALFSNRIPAIRIPGFAGPVECRAFANGLRQCDLRVVTGVTDHSAPSFEMQKIAFIELTQFEFAYRPIEDYLDAAEASREEVAPVFAAAFDPVERLMARRRACVEDEMTIARTPAAGLIRRRSSAAPTQFSPCMRISHPIRRRNSPCRIVPRNLPGTFTSKCRRERAAYGTAEQPVDLAALPVQRDRGELHVALQRCGRRAVLHVPARGRRSGALQFTQSA